MQHVLKFPLVNSINLALPKGAEIAEAFIEGDIARLRVENFPLAAKCMPGGKWVRTQTTAEGNFGPLETEAHKLLIFMGGEKRKVEIKGGEDDGKVFEEEILIPEPSETLRKLGVLKTTETPATFHVFLEVKPE